MNLRDNRRARLRQLIKQQFGGVAARFAEVMEWPPTDVSRYYVKGKHGRSITEDKAREIEHKCRLERYWLDQPEVAALKMQQTIPAYVISEATQHKLLEAYSFLTPDQQEDILDQMHAYRKANEAAVKHLVGRFKTVSRERAADKLPVAPAHK